MKHQQSFWYFLIKWLGKLFDSWLFFKSFSTADSLEQYYNRGYWYGFGFLVFLGGLIFALQYSGLYLSFLTNTGTDLPQELQDLLKNAKEFIGLKNIIPNSIIAFPLYFLIPILYLFINFIPWLKKKIGEWISRFLLFVFSKSIDVGEWFINHRWSSIFTILALTFLIAFGLYYLIDQYSDKKQLRKDLMAWFDRTEEFIEASPLSENEYEKYTNNVKKYWSQDFEAFFGVSEKNTSSFSILNSLLNELYGEPNLSRSWFTYLGDIKLNNIVNRKHGKNITDEEKRAWCLTHILVGRIYNRKFQRYFSESAYPQDIHINLKLAQDEFNSASNILKTVKSQNESWVKKYRSAINNGLGNVYSNQFNFLVKKPSPTENVEVDKNIFDGCKYARDCVAITKNHFDEASKDFGECSFQSKRSTNNIADLYVRIAQNYDYYSKSVSLDENKNEISRIELSEVIDKQITNLTKCLNKPPFIPVILLTLSQASAHSADLKIKEGQDGSAQLVNSANYLKLAYNFSSPSSFLDWDLEPYCNFVKNSPRSEKMLKEGNTKYKPYQDTFSKLLEKSNSGDLESPSKQINRRIIELCQ